MVKLVKRYSVNEAKQVGTLYHVCTLEAVADYIAPTDTLKGSGKYKNWILGGRTDVVPFTRDKNFIVNVGSVKKGSILIKFEVDGNRLSEKHKIVPYNDLDFDIDTGELDTISTDPKYLEHEESVLGSIKNFSKYVKNIEILVHERVLFNPSIEGLNHFCSYIDKAFSYLSKFSVRKISTKLKADFFYMDSVKRLKDFLYAEKHILSGDFDKEDIKVYLTLPVEKEELLRFIYKNSSSSLKGTIDNLYENGVSVEDILKDISSSEL